MWGNFPSDEVGKSYTHPVGAGGRGWHDRSTKEQTSYRKTANLSVARMSSWVRPGLSAAWPALSTITNSARGHTRLSSHAFAMGDGKSKQPFTRIPGMS